jgi:hypothetical protein
MFHCSTPYYGDNIMAFRKPSPGWADEQKSCKNNRQNDLAVRRHMLSNKPYFGDSSVKPFSRKSFQLSPRRMELCHANLDKIHV